MATNVPGSTTSLLPLRVRILSPLIRHSREFIQAWPYRCPADFAGSPVAGPRKSLKTLPEEKFKFPEKTPAD